MKCTLLYIAVLFLPVVLFAQQRQALKGKAISDIYKVESLTVQNLSAKTATVTNNEGDFSLPAAVGDTLFFSGITFRDLYVTLQEKDLNEPLLVIRLEVNVIQLEEARVNQLTGNLAIDSKNSKIDVEMPKFNAAEINKDRLNSIAGNGQGMDFAAIYTMIAGRPKSRPKTAPYNSGKVFAVAVKEKYSGQFFTKGLKIPTADIDAFLHYCDSGPGIQYLLMPKNELQLISYLENRSIDYLNNKP